MTTDPSHVQPEFTNHYQNPPAYTPEGQQSAPPPSDAPQYYQPNANAAPPGGYGQPGMNYGQYAQMPQQPYPNTQGPPPPAGNYYQPPAGAAPGYTPYGQPTYAQPQPNYGQPQPYGQQPMYQQQPPMGTSPPPGGYPGQQPMMAQPVLLTQPGTVVIQQGIPTTAVIINGTTRFPANPFMVHCPHCNRDGLTRCEKIVGCGNWLWCGGLAVLGCWMGCCLIPFCVQDLHDTIHHCSSCNKYIGRRNNVDC